MWAETSRLDFTLPFVALSAGKKLDRGIQNYLPDPAMKIEDLWINCFCVSANLITHSVVVHNKGLLWKAMRASVSLPAIYPPVPTKDGLLIDGGVINRMPVDIMRESLRGGTVVVSDIVGASEPWGDYSSVPANPSGWRLLVDAISFRKLAAKIPMNIVDILLEMGGMSSARDHDSMLEETDAYVVLDMCEYGFSEYNKYREMADTGYRQAREQLKRMKIRDIVGI